MLSLVLSGCGRDGHETVIAIDTGAQRVYVKEYQGFIDTDEWAISLNGDACVLPNPTQDYIVSRSGPNQLFVGHDGAKTTIFATDYMSAPQNAEAWPVEVRRVGNLINEWERSGMYRPMGLIPINNDTPRITACESPGSLLHW